MRKPVYIVEQTTDRPSHFSLLHVPFSFLSLLSFHPSIYPSICPLSHALLLFSMQLFCFISLYSYIPSFLFFFRSRVDREFNFSVFLWLLGWKKALYTVEWVVNFAAETAPFDGYSALYVYAVSSLLKFSRTFYRWLISNIWYLNIAIIFNTKTFRTYNISVLYIMLKTVIVRMIECHG